jgi:phosphoesterase RecJ-like protein
MTKRDQMIAIASALGNSNSVLILSHKNPDGDALGSTLGLGLALKNMGKTVDMVNISGIPDNLRWLPGSEMLSTAPNRDASYDAVVILDCSELERTGFEPNEITTHLHHIVIDHHPREFDPLDTELVDTTAAAAGQLVYDILKLMDAPVDADSATCLYVALYTDTGGFRFSNTTTDAFLVAAQLTSAGVMPSHVSEMIHDQEKAERYNLLALALSTLTLSDCARMADLVVTREMFEQTGTDGSDTDGFVNYPRTIKGVEVAILFKELDDNSYRIGLRSQGTVDVSAIARSFGGGGHRNASGVTMQGTVTEIRQKILDLVLKDLEGR